MARGGEGRFENLESDNKESVGDFGGKKLRKSAGCIFADWVGGGHFHGSS